MYAAMALTMLYHLDFGYVTKMQYNKDKDLVFVTRPNRIWGEKEHVYEVHHLEQMVPAPVTALQHHSSHDPKGIMKVYDMAQHEVMLFYKEDKYWNSDLKKEFLDETESLWKDTHADKNAGRIFSLFNTPDQNSIAALNKVEKEMQAAIDKFGKAKLPTSHHIADFYKDIDNKKEDIASASH